MLGKVMALVDASVDAQKLGGFLDLPRVSGTHPGP